MRNSLSIASLLLTGLILTAAASAADPVYKWTDSTGHSHYSQTPPEGQKYKTITTAGTVADTNAAAPVADAVAAGTPKAPTDTPATPAQVARQKLCDGARTNLNTLNTHATVIGDANGDGKPVTLNAAQHDAAQAEARKQVDLYCSK